jgi:hypothetical protein
MSFSLIEKIVSALLSVLKMFIDEKERERENDKDKDIIDRV